MRNRWFIGLKEKGLDVFDMHGLTLNRAAEGFYWADPFLAEEDGKRFIFMEEYDYTKGYLVCAELDGLEVRNVKKILDLSTHCSFPSVTKIGDEWYMTPENVLSGELWVYRAKKFPYEWERFSLVAKGRYDDPILRWEGGFIIETSTDGDKRRIFRNTDSIGMKGEWNLVWSADEMYSRRAGHDFVHPTLGTISPMQDSVPIYGWAIVFKNHARQTVHWIEPDWMPHLTGTHTFSTSEHLVAVDARVRVK